MTALILKLRTFQQRLVGLRRRQFAKLGSNCRWYQCKAKNLLGL